MFQGMAEIYLRETPLGSGAYLGVGHLKGAPLK